jgi:hypothetical protein
MQVALAATTEEINPMWVLCDNDSTIDVFKNRAILVNIRRADKPIKLKGIEGKTIKINEEGDLIGYGKVYYHPQVTANVLSFHDMARRFSSIIYNNKEKDAFLVTRDDGTTMEFIPSAGGLYYYDFNHSIQWQVKKQTTMVVHSVEGLQRNYTEKELKRVEEARRLYVIMGRPSKADFFEMIKRGKLHNNPITITDYNNAEKIYGANLGVIKGKTVRVKPKHVTIDVETAARERFNIILAVDVMHFTNLNFLVTVSRNLHIITTTLLTSQKKKTIVQAMT